MAKVWRSSAQMEWCDEIRSGGELDAAMRWVNGTIPRTLFSRAPTLLAWRFAKFGPADSCREAARTADFVAFAIISDHIAVMFHLRSLYVIKAAIFTIPL